MRRLALLIGLLFIAWATPARAQIAVDATSNSGSGNSGTSYTWSHTVGSGSNRAIVCSEVGITNTSMGMKYNGSSLTQVQFTPAGSGYNVWIGYLMNPPSGSNTVEADFGTSQSITWSQAGCVSLTGVNQSGVDSSGCNVNNMAIASAISCNVTTVAANAWIFNIAISNHGNSDMMAPTTGMPAWTASSSGQLYGGGGGYQGPIATPASTATGWTSPGGFTWESMGAFSLAPAAPPATGGTVTGGATVVGGATVQQ